ncbi:MAG: hypothetical protein IKE29_07290 [Paenibacillus sp.]|uniref:hypothetical protein n=1 Tax=Paenibacillus sp. TaxID=58172 RepID=UPI0025D5B882|nr:hypothetical protein [Paenibacillus sp.]MBR2564410.1 hypothetical protein [Paenibacillus sp.]
MAQAAMQPHLAHCIIAMPPQQQVQHGISPRAFGYGIVPNARTKGRDGTTSRPFFTTKLK